MSVPLFFKTFYELNQHHRFFSYRYIASKLNWPVSYLKEVISGKRSLTIARGVQFARFANYDPLETEALLLLSIRAVLIENGEEKISDLGLVSRRDTRYEKDEDYSYIYNHQVLTIFYLIVWAKGEISAEEILEKSAVYKWTLEEIRESLSCLEKKGAITFISPGKYSYSKDPMILDEKEVKAGEDSPFTGLELHRDAALGFVNFCDNPQRASCYNTGCIEMPLEDFRETALKIIALRNWLLECSQVRTEKKEKKNDTVVFQFDLNLFPLMNLKSD